MGEAAPPPAGGSPVRRPGGRAGHRSVVRSARRSGCIDHRVRLALQDKGYLAAAMTPIEVCTGQPPAVVDRPSCTYSSVTSRRTNQRGREHRGDHALPEGLRRRPAVHAPGRQLMIRPASSTDYVVVRQRPTADNGDIVMRHLRRRSEVQIPAGKRQITCDREPRARGRDVQPSGHRVRQVVTVLRRLKRGWASGPDHPHHAQRAE